MPWQEWAAPTLPRGGTIFVDHQLRILRFTPAASEIINLILSDIGRPVGHIVTNLVGGDRLVADVRAVLGSLIPTEVELQTIAGMWYRMRIQPYRTLDNVIEGAVISFIDITEMKKVRDELLKANELLRLAVVLRDAHDAITVQDMEGRILAWNPGAVRIPAPAFARVNCGGNPEGMQLTENAGFPFSRE